MDINWYYETLNEIAAVEEEIEQLKIRLNEKRLQKTRLKRKIYEGRTNTLRGSDSLFVLSREISPLIERWINAYNEEFGKGGQLILAERSNVSTRLIRKIINNPNNNGEQITFQTADRLLSAIDLDVNNLTIKNHRRKLPKRPPSQYYEE